MTTTTTPTAPPWPDDPADCCRRFFREVEVAKAPNRKIGTSYYLKHVVEAAGRSYVPMQTLLDVAAELGIQMEPCTSGPNYWLAVTARSVNRFMQRYGIRCVA